MSEKIKIFDSSTTKNQDFTPLKQGEVSIYVCGPTVYDDAHLGHARSAIVFDLWRRLFEAEGYRVIFIKNFTDIDDKIIKKSIQTGKSIESITDHYISSYLKDMDSLYVKRADKEPKATESLDEIYLMIQTLLHKGCAYQISNGDIYFNVNKDNKYGSISNRYEYIKDLVNRIEINKEKKDIRDFVLWKSYKGREDIGYESPFGKGRPGWHIECSAMVEKYFHTHCECAIDIHAGGSDLIFPHHENEASQTRCATGREIAKYWIHNGFVTINEEKMSKSLGNSFFIKDALKEYDGETLRFYLLSTHYRATLNFSTFDLMVSKKRLDRIYRLKKRIDNIKTQGQPTIFFNDFKKKFRDALRDDLNISVALSVIDEYIHASNEKLDKNPKDKTLKNDIVHIFEEISQLLGICNHDTIAYFQQGVSSNQREKIQELIQKRINAKKEKDFKKADEIRNMLHQEGITLLDTPNGTIWEKMQIQ